MRESASHLLIQGNFAQPGSTRLLRILTRVLSILLVVLLLGALGVYGVKVHFEDTINRTARQTRDLNEANKDLQVQLNHIRSFKNVEAAATKVPHLHLAETVIEVPAPPPYKFVSVPKIQQEAPRVYGY